MNESVLADRMGTAHVAYQGLLGRSATAKQARVMKPRMAAKEPFLKNMDMVGVSVSVLEYARWSARLPSRSIARDASSGLMVTEETSLWKESLSLFYEEDITSS